MTQKPIQKLLVTALKRTDETHVDLVGQGHRYVDIHLFDISELATVGIADYASLTVGETVPCRFFAYYVESDKINKSGNPYKDLYYLEPIEPPVAAPVPATDDAVLVELRQIRTLLQEILLALSHDPGYKDPRIDGSNETSDVPAALIGPAHKFSDEGQPADTPTETDSQAAMKAFYARAGEAIRVGRMKATSVNELIDTAGRHGWKAALIRLDTALEVAKSYEATV